MVLNLAQTKDSMGRAVALASGRIVLRHTFTAANSDTEIPAADTGQATEVLGSAVFGIASNQAKYVSGSVDGDRYVVWDSGIADGSTQIALATVESGMHLVFRCSDVENLLLVAAESNPRYALYRKEAGAFNLLNSWAGTPASGDVVRARYVGSAITVTINGVERITATESFNATATKVGFGPFTALASARWDNLIVRG